MRSIHIADDKQQMGKMAAHLAAKKMLEVIAQNGKVRILISTGESQFPFFDAICQEDIPWDKVEVFHLDEYVDLPQSHVASFRKYIKERFADIVKPSVVHYVDGEHPQQAIEALTEEIRKAPIDVGIIGIGENGHIAFNDPPAVFEEEASYKVVNLNDTCKRQQVREGWFPNMDAVPKQAITATVPQIMRCKTIISVVPNECKAQAVQHTLRCEISPDVPATILKTHADWHLFLDPASASLL